MTAVLDISDETRQQARDTLALYKRIGLPVDADLLARAGVQAVPEQALRQVRPFSTIAPERVDWLWSGYLPKGKLAILDGDPGLGKSTVAIDIAARVSRGLAMPDGSAGVTGYVLVHSAEDGAADTIRPRLDAAGADTNRVGLLPDGLTLPGDVGRLKGWIEDTGANLLILDPLMAYIGSGLKANSDQDVRKALAPLSQLAEMTGCSVLVIRHLRKAESSTAVYRGGGSIGIIGQARIGLAVARDPDDEDKRLLLVTKSNLGPMPASLSFSLAGWTGTNGIEASKVEWLGADDRTADDLLTGQQDERPARTKDRPHEREGKALRGIVQAAGGAMRGTEALAALAELGYRYEQTGYAVTRLRLEAGVSTKQVGSREGSFSLWYIEEDEGNRPVVYIEGAA